MSVQADLAKNGTVIDSSGAYSGGFNVNTDGVYTITVNASDGFASASASDTVTIDDDLTPPEITFGGSDSLQLLRDDQALTWAATDDSGIAAAEVVLLKDGTQIFSSPDASGSFDFNSYGSGNYTVTVTATDADTDRSSDSLTSQASQSFTIAASTLFDIMENPTPDAGDLFGYAVATDGNLTVATAAFDDSGAPNAGIAYVYDNATGQLVSTLQVPVPRAEDHLGLIAAIDDGVVLLAVLPDDSGAPDTGIAYLFDAATGQVLHRLLNPEPDNSDEFGVRLAIDGNLAVVSAIQDDFGAQNSGSVYVFDVTTGELKTTIRNPTPAANDSFGIGLDIDGYNVVVGAYLDDTSAKDAGIAYVFNALTGSLVHTLLNPDPQTNDRFGGAVAIDEDRIVVGALSDSSNGHETGRAYLFDVTTGGFVATLPNPAPTISDWFGYVVGLDGGLAVVGGPWNDTTANNGGAVYLFSSEDGTLLHTVANPAPAAGDYFGKTLAVSGNTLVIGAEGADTTITDTGRTYLFHFGPTDLSLEQAQLAPDHAVYGTVSGNSADELGSAIASYGDLVLVGAPVDDVTGTDSGAAYLYRRTTGELLHTFMAPAGQSGDLFGLAVTLTADYAIVGAYLSDTSVADAGAVFVFDVTTGALVRTILNPSPQAGDGFGISVSADGNQLLVGELLADDDAINAGLAHVFNLDTGALIRTFHNPSPNSNDRLGYSVALDGGQALVAAYFDDTIADDAGAAYVFDVATGQLLQTLLVPDAGAGDRLGLGLDLDDGYAVIGAYQNDTGAANGGRAYIFDVTTGSIVATLDNPTPVAGDFFGYSVSIDAGIALVGSPGVGGGIGEAFLYSIPDGELLMSLQDPLDDYDTSFGVAVALSESSVSIGADRTSTVGQYSGAAYFYTVHPSDLAFDQYQISENAAVGSTVGILTAMGGLGAMTFDLVSGAGDTDNAAFTIEGALLKTAAPLDFETQDTFRIRVRVTDAAGLTFEKELTITVADVFELAAINLADGGTLATMQRSNLNELVLSFDRPIEFDPGAFVVRQRGPAGGIVTTTATATVDSEGNTIVTLTFSGEYARGTTGNLVDGNYEVVVDGSKIRLAGTTQQLDADGDGNGGGFYIFGDDEEDDFFALYGDENGDRRVDQADQTAMRATYRRRAGQAGYDAAFDYDGDGDIDGLDYLYFRRNYGDMLLFE